MCWVCWVVQWVKLPAWKFGDCGFEPALAFKPQRNKMFLPRPFLKIDYCGEPPWPRSGVLGLRPPGLEFRILCLEGSVISFISPSSGGYPGPVCSQRCCRRGVMRHNILIGVFCIRSRDRAHLNTLLRKKVAICNWYILQAGMMPGYFGCINPSYPPNCLFSSAAAIPISRTSYITF